MTTREQNVSPAEVYQSYFGPAMLEPLADRVLALDTPAPGERVLDVACGTGILTRKLATATGAPGRVVGVDVNPAMVEVAQRFGGAIEYEQGDGTALALPDAAFDAVYCQQGLQYFPDRAAGAREMRRVVGNGGRAVVVCWLGLDAHPIFAALAEAEAPQLAAAGVEVDPAELIAPFSLGEADALTALFTDAGFGDVRVQEVSIDARFADADRFVEHMEFAYAAVVPEFVDDPAAFARFLDGVAEATRDVVASYRRGDDIVFPMHANVAIAKVT